MGRISTQSTELSVQMTSLRRKDIFPTEVTAENFVETEFEEKFGLFASQFGFAGKEFELRRKLTEDDFEFPNPDRIVNYMEEVEREIEDPDDRTKTRKARILVSRTGKYKDAYADRYRAEVSQALKNKQQYRDHLQTLCAELLLCLDKNLRSAVTQHTKYKEAKASNDIVELFNIVKECAVGRGALSVYVHAMRFLNIRQKAATSADFADYTKNYEDIVTDIRSIGTAEEILQALFNAKFVEGLNKEMFREQVTEVMGAETWPNYSDLAAKLRRFVTAMTGIREAIGRESMDGVAVTVDAARTREYRPFVCFNCNEKNAAHSFSNCPKQKATCAKCGERGHMTEHCEAVKRIASYPRAAAVPTPEKTGGTASPIAERTPRGGRGGGRSGRMMRGGRGGSRAGGRGSPRRTMVRAAETASALEESMHDDEGYEDAVEEGEYGEDAADVEEDYSGSGYYYTAIVADVGVDADASEVLAMKSKTEQGDRDVSQAQMVIDSGCVGSTHVVNDPALLSAVTPGKIHVTGYDGEISKVDQVGRVDGLGTAALVPKAPNNLVNLKKLCREINGRYEGDDKQITIYDGHGRVYVTGRDNGDGFLSFLYGDVRQYDGVRANSAGVTAEEARQPHFTPEEIARAREAYR